MIFRRHRRLATLLIAAMLLPAARIQAAAPPEGTLVIQVDNVRNAAGRIHADVCTEGRFLKDGCPFSAEAPAHPGETTLTVRGVPPGRYAVQLFHDENLNGKVDRGLFGIPKEGVGFSNDAPIRFGPPKFAAAAIDLAAGSRTIGITMHYFAGQSGPAAAR